MSYRKKPVIIEAFQLGVDPIPEWFMDKVSANDIILHGASTGFYNGHDVNCDIKTLEGTMHGEYSDFIIQGVHGECYPCKPDIFKETYEYVENG